MGRGSSKAGGGGGSLKNPRDFASPTETAEFFEKTGFLEGLEDNERKGIHTYTTNEYKRINESLRGKREMTEQTKKDIADIDAGIAKSILKEPIVAYRNSWPGLIPGLPDNPTVKDLRALIGGEFIERGYSSTSVGQPGALADSGKVLMKINVPSGIGFGGFIAPISDFHSESEFLVKRNAHYRIKGVEKASNGKMALVIDLIG